MTDTRLATEMAQELGITVMPEDLPKIVAAIQRAYAVGMRDQAAAPLWAFMHTGCIYESAFAVVSLHRTKAAAWRAMHTAQWNAWVELQHSQRMPRGEGLGRDRGAKAYEHEASKVQRMEVSQ